jgi:hypothetical protein
VPKRVGRCGNIRPRGGEMEKFVGHFALISCRRAVLLVAMAYLSSGLVAGSVAAADADGSSTPSSVFDSKLSLALGGFFPYVDSTVSINPSGGGSGANVDLEEDLGLDDTSASAWLTFNWRFLPRHKFTAEWFQLNRDGTETAGTQFMLGDTAVGLGASLSSSMDVNLGRLTYGYSIVRDDKLDVGFLAGLHVATAKVSATASGNITVNGMPVLSGTSTESTSAITFPLPHIGASLDYKFAPRWTAQFMVLAFALEVDKYSGSLIEVDTGVNYQLSKHFGIGGGIKYFRLNLQAQDSGAGAEFNFQFLGPAIYGIATF